MIIQCIKNCYIRVDVGGFYKAKHINHKYEIYDHENKRVLGHLYEPINFRLVIEECPLSDLLWF